MPIRPTFNGFLKRAAMISGICSALPARPQSLVMLARKQRRHCAVCEARPTRSSIDVARGFPGRSSSNNASARTETRLHRTRPPLNIFRQLRTTSCSVSTRTTLLEETENLVQPMSHAFGLTLPRADTPSYPAALFPTISRFSWIGRNPEELRRLCRRLLADEAPPRFDAWPTRN